MKRVIYIILSFAWIGLQGQCIYPFADSTVQTVTVAYGDSINCHAPCVSCSYNASFLVPPMDGTLEIGSDYGTVGVIVRSECNKIAIDTCVNPILPMAVFGYVKYSSIDTSIVTLCAPSGSFVSLSMVSWMGTGHIPLIGYILTDTLCPSPVNIAPIQVKRIDTLLISEFDLTGRPFTGSGVYIEAVELMDGSFVYRKKYKFQ
jgi:hypothetical protein